MAGGGPRRIVRDNEGNREPVQNVHRMWQGIYYRRFRKKLKEKGVRKHEMRTRKGDIVR